MFVCCECCVFSGRRLCDGLIIDQRSPYRLWCVGVCDLETKWMRKPWTTGGLSRQKKKKIVCVCVCLLNLNILHLSWHCQVSSSLILR
jgi:hypothetical protein